MKRGKGFNILIVALSVAALATFTVTAIAADVPRMTKEELKSQLGKADVVIVDVRIGKDCKASEFKIKEAVRGICQMPIHGSPSIQKTRPWFSTVLDQTRAPVPVCHAHSWTRATPRFTLSKAAGTNGSGQNTQQRRSS